FPPSDQISEYPEIGYAITGGAAARLPKTVGPHTMQRQLQVAYMLTPKIGDCNSWKTWSLYAPARKDAGRRRSNRTNMLICYKPVRSEAMRQTMRSASLTSFARQANRYALVVPGSLKR
ncbi:MAG: hypothetical protein K2X55_02820, partial [Burkholderiaceae bacterium]|nr:hypothetical protein [Burkholderiaceae bacterium]